MNAISIRGLVSIVAVGVMAGLFAGPASAKSAEQIEIEVDAALKAFESQVNGGKEFLAKASGVLFFPKVFPKIVKGGLIIGGQYGEGALRIDGKTVEYYSTAAASIGLQLGGQARTQIVVFMAKDALDAFRASKGWEVGVDGSIAVIQWGAGEDLRTLEINDPVVAFIFGNKGFMFNVNLEG